MPLLTIAWVNLQVMIGEGILPQHSIIIGKTLHRKANITIDRTALDMDVLT